MKKYFYKFTAFFISVAFLTGCSGDNMSETETEAIESITAEASQSNAPVTTVFFDSSEQYGELISIYPYADIIPEYKKVEINGLTSSRDYKGLGITVNESSSRLLFDYKEEDLSAYETLLEKLFGQGFGLSKINIVVPPLHEFSDILNNTSFKLAFDAESINPDIMLELSFDGANGSYQYCREVIEAAYDVFGLEFDYISFVNADADFITAVANGLKAENDARYDYNMIKITVSDVFADEMLENAEIRNAADIIRINSIYSDAEVTELSEKYGKEIWRSNGEAPSEITNLSTNAKGGGLSGNGNALDICNRIINGFASGKTSLYEYAEAVSADYPVINTLSKSLITANSPWNGKFLLNTGYWTSLHFSGFAENGWKFVDSACFGDGNETDGAISDTKNNYITLADPNTGDFSIIICNDSNMKRGYTFTVTNLDNANSLLHVWETAGYSDEGFDYSEYNYNYMRLTDEFYAVEQIPGEGAEPDENGIIISEGENGLYPHAFSVTVKPYSVMTVTTLDKYGEIPDIGEYAEYSDTSSYDDNFAETLSLPFNDDYEYADEFVLPKYTLDLYGVFEVLPTLDSYGDENNALVQTTKKSENSGAYPLAILGDDRWSDYTAKIDFLLDKNGGLDNFVQLGIRNNLTSCDPITENGYSIRVYQNGNWELNKNSEVVQNGSLVSFDPSVWHTVEICAEGRIISAFIDGNPLTSFDDTDAFINSGRISISSAYNENCFDNLTVDEADGLNPYIVRVDDRDYQISYDGLNGCEIVRSRDYDYTLTDLKQGASFEIWFYGTEISFIGKADNAVFKIWIDGEELENNFIADSPDVFSAAARISGLEQNSYSITAELLSGEFILNHIEYK